MPHHTKAQRYVPTVRKVPEVNTSIDRPPWETLSMENAPPEGEALHLVARRGIEPLFHP